MKKFLAILTAAAIVFALIPAYSLAAGMDITSTLPTVFITGVPATFDIGTIANDDAGKLVRARFTLPAGATIEYREGGVDPWIELTDVFGPATGFPLGNVITTFRGTFDQAGSYTVNVEFVEVATGLVLASRNITATVIDPVSVTANLPTFTEGVPSTFTIGTLVNDEAFLGVPVRAYFTLPAGAVIEYQEGGAGPWIPLTDVFGPAAGFPLGNITTTFRGTFAAPGSYTVRVEFIKTGKYEGSGLLGSRDITALVVGKDEVHTVSYHPNGGSGTVPTDMNRYYYGEQVMLKSGAGLTMPGKVFAGWSLTGDESIQMIPYTMGNSDVTFFAVWADASDLKIPKTGGGASIFGFALLIAGLASAAFVLLKKRSAVK